MGYSRTTQHMVERNAGMYDKPMVTITKVACAKHDIVICKCVSPCPACICMTKLGGTFK